MEKTTMTDAPKTLEQSKTAPQPGVKSLDQIKAEQEQRNRDRAAASQGIDPKTGEPRKAPAAPAPNTAQTQADIDAEAKRQNVKTNVVDPVKQAAVQDKAMAARNEANEAGHDINQQKIHDQAVKAQEGKLPPHIGKARDLNTPIIDPKTGAKTWA